LISLNDLATAGVALGFGAELGFGDAVCLLGQLAVNISVDPTKKIVMKN